MEKNELNNLFSLMKKVFNCHKLIIETYSDAFSNVNYAFFQNADTYVAKEAERRAVAFIYNNVVRVNLSVVEKLSIEYVEKILIHEITHYLLLPRDKSDHPQFFWDEFYNNCKKWNKERT